LGLQSNVLKVIDVMDKAVIHAASVIEVIVQSSLNVEKHSPVDNGKTTIMVMWKSAGRTGSR
jgi:hypothetical protein